ncbi:MAG TPA: protein kinase [Thermoanaerobaculia bacterium]|nr:protein kinase [Thermoanaerobaculia bacterium]
MAERRDRLTGMTGLPAKEHAPTQRLDPTVAVPRPVRRQALLYAPPPATPAPYITLLEAEGWDLLVANSPESATILLANSSPTLIIALVPILGDDLRDLFRKYAPSAEVRAFPGLMPVLEDAVVRPRDAFEFAIRSIVATAGVVSSIRKTPRERTVRILQLTEKASTALRFTSADAAAARVIAALYDIPHALSADTTAKTDAQDAATRNKERNIHRSLLAEFIAGLSAPFPIVLTAPPGDPSQRMPTPLEIVEAAGAFAVMTEVRMPQPEVALRKLALSGDIHSIAAEAVINASTKGAAANRGRILIVDGDPGARNLLALRLANEGYTTDIAADGRAALESVRRDPPALIISETLLAGLDGFALLDTLRHERRHIPFVFLSARNDAMSMNKGLLLGAADFLPKPINTEVLLTKLQKVMGQAFAPTDASARLTLSDVTRAGQPEQTTLTYSQLAPGVTLLGRFKLEKDLGEGGMGKVFKARDERLEEDVVLKVMKDSLTGDPKVLEHFKREIRLARKISHPSVVRIFDFFEVGSLKFVTMEYLHGTDLAHEIVKRGAFPTAVALRLGAEFFEGLAAAHDLNVVHRDIKPHNVFLLAGGHVKILDFGIAQGLDPERPDHTMTQSIIGTPDYMSPEQLLGQKVDARTDIYSAGVMLYELLTGSLPFEGKEATERITSRLNRTPDAPSKYAPRIPHEVDAFILRLLARNRDERWADARSAAAELRNLIKTIR